MYHCKCPNRFGWSRVQNKIIIFPLCTNEQFSCQITPALISPKTLNQYWLVWNIKCSLGPLTSINKPFPYFTPNLHGFHASTDSLLIASKETSTSWAARWILQHYKLQLQAILVESGVVIALLFKPKYNVLPDTYHSKIRFMKPLPLRLSTPDKYQSLPQTEIIKYQI